MCLSVQKNRVSIWINQLKMNSCVKRTKHNKKCHAIGAMSSRRPSRPSLEKYYLWWQLEGYFLKKNSPVINFIRPSRSLDYIHLTSASRPVCVAEIMLLSYRSQLQVNSQSVTPVSHAHTIHPIKESPLKVIHVSMSRIRQYA